MTIEGLSDARRIGRDFKVRLGVRWKRGPGGGRVSVGRTDDNRDTYPQETDYFVIDEAPQDVIDVYGPKPKSLRIMLYAEWDSRTPDGEDLVFSLYNRAYAQTKGLRCKGTGRSREEPGTAATDDEKWARRIEQATGEAPELIPSTSGTPRWRVRCLGRDCPKYLHLTTQPDPDDPSKTKQLLAPEHDRDASCKAVGILRCFLLNPSTNPEDREHYCAAMGVMELATGSIHSIIDLQSDFDLMLRPFTGGRTAGIPLTLVRKPTTTYRPVKQVHHTCAVRFDHREVQRWAAVPVDEVFLTDVQRDTLHRLEATPLGLTVESVRGLLPDRLLPQPAEVLQDATEPKAAGGTESSAEGAGDATELPETQATASGPGPILVADQINGLKDLAGGRLDPTRPFDQVSNPYRDEAVTRLKGAVKAMNQELGTSVERLSELRVEHLPWLEERLRGLPPLEDPS